MVISQGSHSVISIWRCVVAKYKDAQNSCDITAHDVTESEENVDNILDETIYYDVSVNEDFNVSANEDYNVSASGDHYSTSLPSCTSMNSMQSVEIRKELLLFGQSDIGPIIPTTRRTYLVRLKKLRQGYVESPKHCVGNFNGGSLQKLSSMIKLDDEMSRKFVELNCETKSAINLLTRDGILRSSFNYLLLDPSLTQVHMKSESRFIPVDTILPLNEYKTTVGIWNLTIWNQTFWRSDFKCSGFSYGIAIVPTI